MARRGLNCFLTYPRDGKTRGYRVRCKQLSMGYEMIGQESQARSSRAYYPAKTSPTQFSITVDLIGQAEKKSFNQFMMRYAEYILDPAIKGAVTPQMRVRLPYRNFVRVGVPVGGVEFGDRLGAMVWSPTITFETSREPMDWRARVKFSEVDSVVSDVMDENSQYFYPTGIQLTGSQGAAITAAVSGGLRGVGNAVSDTIDAISDTGDALLDAFPDDLFVGSGDTDAPDEITVSDL